MTKEEDLSVLESVDLSEVEPDVSPLGGDIPEEPLMSDPEWSNFVMGHFVDDELDKDGKPLVHGLRRVVRKLLGPVLESEPDVIQCPAFIPGNERLTLLQPAVVKHRVRVLMCRLESGMSAAYPITFAEVADVYFGNTDPNFVRYATAMASTRAEARCLRKMLQLRCVASEETTNLPVEDASVDGFITPTQVTFLNVLCKRCDIDLMKFISSGKNQYTRVQDVPFARAVKMVEVLSGYQTDPSKIPDNIKGYDSCWMS